MQADEISKIGRATQGVRIMKLKGEESKVVSIALTPHEDEEPELPEGEDVQPEGEGPQAGSAAAGETSSDGGAAAVTAEAAPDGGTEE